MRATLYDLDAARATVVTDQMSPGQLIASLGGTDAHVMLMGTAVTLRRLFGDGLAQLDAIASLDGDES
jgi:hypothetical protein